MGVWLLAWSFAGSASATVIGFDDAAQGEIAAGYAGLNWGRSTLSRPYADSTSFAVSSDMSYSNPHSPDNFALNGYGVPDLWFEFPTPVTFKGAWVAAPKMQNWAAQQLRFSDDAGHTTPWLDLTQSPQFLPADFSGAKKIYVQPHMVYDGTSVNGGWFTIDDITYVDPAVTRSFTLSISGAGGGAVNSVPSGLVACSYSPLAGTCTSSQPDGASLTLTVTPAADSELTAWTGACSSCSGATCVISLDSNRDCSVSFRRLDFVRKGSDLFKSIMPAYAQLSLGLASELELRGVELAEDILFDQNIPVILKGGFDPSFTTRSGYTTLLGTVSITKGSIRADMVKIR